MKKHTHVRNGRIITKLAVMDDDGKTKDPAVSDQFASINQAKRASRGMRAIGAIVRTAESLLTEVAP